MATLRTVPRRLLRTPTGATSAVLLLLLVAIAIIGPAIWGDAAQELDPAAARQGISSEHWLGTDDLGRDVLARTLAATRLSLALALAAAAIAAVLGCVLGAMSAIAGGRLRTALAGAVHWALAFPPLIVALFVTAVIGPGATGAILAIGLALVPSFARVAQTLAVQVASSDYVAAARTVGVGPRALVARYVLPNIAEPLIIQATVTVGIALVAISALSFLGLGVQPPQFDWGRMLAEGLDKIYTTPVVALAPAGAIILTGITFSLLGDGIATAFQPGGGARSARPAAGRRPLHRRIGRRAATRPPAIAGGDVVMDVEGLTVGFDTPAGEATVVRDVSLRLRRGDRVGIVGESGSGKTMTALAIAQLLPTGARASATRMAFDGHELGDEGGASVRRLLGLELAMVFQDPGSSLNPALRVGRQLAEGVQEHRGLSAKSAMAEAVRKLREVHVPAAERRARQHPHEFSGGMRQRAMIAMGLMGEPKLIVADEPTTALDVTVQAQILDLLREVNATYETAIVLISHDVAVVADFCTRVIVMYAGTVVEEAGAETLLDRPAHPYTRALIDAVPDLHTDVEQPLATIPGRPAGPDDVQAGCPFAPRCPLAVAACEERPPLREVAPGQRAACWRAEDVAAMAAGAEGRTSP